MFTVHLPLPRDGGGTVETLALGAGAGGSGTAQQWPDFMAELKEISEGLFGSLGKQQGDEAAVRKSRTIKRE